MSVGVVGEPTAVGVPGEKIAGHWVWLRCLGFVVLLALRCNAATGVRTKLPVAALQRNAWGEVFLAPELAV